MKPTTTYLQLRKLDGLWVFDDPRHGLVAEPFLTDATALIDAMVKADANGSPTPVLVFSEDSSATFTEMEFIREEAGGVWYRCERFGCEAWLCPQFWKYFERDLGYPPNTFYARAFEDWPMDGQVAYQA